MEFDFTKPLPPFEIDRFAGFVIENRGERNDKVLVAAGQPVATNPKVALVA